MKRDSLRLFGTGALLAFCLVGCCKTSIADDGCVSDMVYCRIDQDVSWNPCLDEDPSTAYLVHELLQTNLTPDSAVQIALLHNPEVQAVYEDIGISESEIVQAGLLQNPLLAAMVRFPHQEHATINTEFSIAQNFLDLLLIPLRQRIAEAAFEQVQRRVADTILNLSFDVQEVYFSLQAEQAKLDLMQPLVEATQAASLLAEGQQQAGNIADLPSIMRKSTYLEAQVELTKSRLEIIRLREKMNQLLGLRSTEICWKIEAILPSLPTEEMEMECVEEIALCYRLDLEIARWEVERIARQFGIKEWWAYTHGTLGVSSEKDPEGITTTGPTLAFELPIFNHGQADRMRLRALFRQSIDRLNALEIQVLADVRLAREQLIIQRELALAYEKEILPLQEQTVALSQRYYNGMLLSVYKLLDTKKHALELQIQYQLTLRDYWLARVKLDRSLGGHLYKVLPTYERIEE